MIEGVGHQDKRERIMRGTITFFGPDIESGKIKGSSGAYYSFRSSDWSCENEPRNGMAVHFDTRDPSSVFRRALRVIPANDLCAH